MSAAAIASSKITIKLLSYRIKSFTSFQDTRIWSIRNFGTTLKKKEKSSRKKIMSERGGGAHSSFSSYRLTFRPRLSAPHSTRGSWTIASRTLTRESLFSLKILRAISAVRRKTPKRKDRKEIVSSALNLWISSRRSLDSPSYPVTPIASIMLRVKRKGTRSGISKVLPFSKMQLRSTWTVSPDTLSNRMFSPCLSPSLARVKEAERKTKGSQRRCEIRSYHTFISKQKLTQGHVPPLTSQREF